MQTMTSKEVVAAVGMSSSVIEALAQHECFPAQVSKGIWLREDIAKWMLDEALPGEMSLDTAWPLNQIAH